MTTTAYATTSGNQLGADAGISICDETGELDRENVGLAIDDETGDLDAGTADVLLDGLGYRRTGPWTESGGQWGAEVETRLARRDDPGAAGPGPVRRIGVPGLVMTTGWPSDEVRDQVWRTDSHLFGPEVRSLGLDDEMEDIELGERVSWWLTSSMCCAAYSGERSRLESTVRMMVGQVSAATTHLGLPFPPEWWPPSAGGLPAWRGGSGSPG